jgi:uncharacterized membrane protein (UPF0127 family)
MPVALKTQILACLSLLVVAVACGGTSAEVLTPTPVFDPAPTVEMVPTATGPAPSETVTPTPSPSLTAPLVTEIGPTAAPVAPTPIVTIDDASFAVELAVTPQQRTQGLSGRPVLPPGTGMLFIFESADRYSFWMKDMRFPLDLVWISAECIVVDITEDVPPPAPGQAVADLPTYRPSEPAQYVLEINSGEVESANIRLGDRVEFGSSLAGVYGC